MLLCAHWKGAKVARADRHSQHPVRSRRSIELFENHDSIESDVYRPERCPVSDRELAAAKPTPLVERGR